MNVFFDDEAIDEDGCDEESIISCTKEDLDFIASENEEDNYESLPFLKECHKERNRFENVIQNIQEKAKETKRKVYTKKETFKKRISSAIRKKNIIKYETEKLNGFGQREKEKVEVVTQKKKQTNKDLLMELQKGINYTPRPKLRCNICKKEYYSDEKEEHSKVCKKSNNDRLEYNTFKREMMLRKNKKAF